MLKLNLDTPLHLVIFFVRGRCSTYSNRISALIHGSFFPTFLASHLQRKEREESECRKIRNRPYKEVKDPSSVNSR